MRSEADVGSLTRDANGTGRGFGDVPDSIVEPDDSDRVGRTHSFTGQVKRGIPHHVHITWLFRERWQA